MSIELERAVLGALMGFKDTTSDIACYSMNRIKPSFFTAQTHVEIFKAIKTLSKSDKQFDSLTVATALKGNSLVEIFDVDNCYKFRGDASTIRSHIESLRSEAMEKYAISKLSDVVDMVANKENGSIKERIGLAESSLNTMINQMSEGDSGGLRDGFYWSNKWFDNLESFHGGDGENFTLGYDGLDEVLQPKGIRPGSLVVVGARPKMGKTFFATGVAEHYVSERDQACCVFSMEMGGADIYERILSGYSKVNSNNYYTNDFDNKSFWDTAGNQNSNLASTKLLIDDTAGISITQIKSEVRKAHRKNKVGCIIVDYLTLMGGDEKAERNDLKYGEITKQLKILAKELECVVLLLTQLNRGLESRTDKRPMPSDSRDTGQIEQDCDIWIGLYRERVYDEKCPYNYTEAIIRLNRAGESGTGYLTLDNGYFENVDTLHAQSVINGHKEDKENKEKEALKNEQQKQSKFKRR